MERETIEKWNRIESQEIDSNTVNQSLTKDQRQYNAAKIVFSTNGARKTGHSCTKQTNLDTELAPLTKINRKWTTDLNVKCITIKVLAGNSKKPR